nr:hypothetical protein [Tanacetum cinerariifolium]
MAFSTLNCLSMAYCLSMAFSTLNCLSMTFSTLNCLSMTFSTLNCLSIAFSTLNRLGLSFMFIKLFIYIRMIMGLNTTDNNINSLLEPDDEDDEEEYLDCEDNEEYFNHENGEDDEEEYLDCEDNEAYFNHEEYFNEEFTFMYLDENNTRIPADKALKNKPIHPIFPLFDLYLLSHEERKQLPINPQVNKFFVESDQLALPSTSECDRIESVAMGPYYKVGHSNSDGRDAFVFLKKPAVEGSSLKANGGQRKGLKAENGKFSGHEVYLRSMGPYYKVGRSNSDGQDAFLFLKKPVRTAVEGSSLKGTGEKRKGLKAKIESFRDMRKGLKAENGKFSGHEVYLRKRAQGEEDRRQSYDCYSCSACLMIVNCALDVSVDQMS